MSPGTKRVDALVEAALAYSKACRDAVEPHPKESEAVFAAWRERAKVKRRATVALHAAARALDVPDATCALCGVPDPRYVDLCDGCSDNVYECTQTLALMVVDFGHSPVEWLTDAEWCVWHEPMIHEDGGIVHDAVEAKVRERIGDERYDALDAVCKLPSYLHSIGVGNGVGHHGERFR